MTAGYKPLVELNDPAARCAGSSYYIYKLLKTSSGVSQEIWMMDAASGGESDPSERPEARSPIIQKNWNQNEQASGRPIEAPRGPAVRDQAIICLLVEGKPRGMRERSDSSVRP
jgi:hypothetical protein